MNILKCTQFERRFLFCNALGVDMTKHLPEHALDSRPVPGYGLWVRLKAIGPKQKSRRMGHRLIVTCWCGKQVSCGRIGQHIRMVHPEKVDIP